MIESDIRQIAIEQELLGHVMQAIRTTMDWTEGKQRFQQKLSTIRFIAQSFQRHLDRLFQLKGFDGYMDMLVESSPHLRDEIDELRHEHEQFRESLGRIIPQMERIGPEDHEEFFFLCNDLRAFLDRLDEHNLKEMYLIQEGSLQVVGGEG
jgi:hypothetical protein